MHKLVINLATVLCIALPALAVAATEEQAPAGQATDPDFSMTVMHAFKIKDKGVAITGRIDSGVVRTGDSVCLTAAKIGTKAINVDAIQLGPNTFETLPRRAMSSASWSTASAMTPDLKGTHPRASASSSAT